MADSANDHALKSVRVANRTCPGCGGRKTFEARLCRGCAPRRYSSPAPVASRFWMHVNKGDGCWEWTASLDRRGYGQFMLAPRTLRRAHRIAWELTNGPIPDGLWALHRCDNPKCVRVDHLFLGTALDNTRDMDAKGRRRNVPSRGEKHWGAKLTETKVFEIRELLATRCPRKEIAARFGVALVTIDAIATGRLWGWLRRSA